MALRTFATIVGPATMRGRATGVLVDVLRLDTALLGKALQIPALVVVETTGAADDLSAVRAAFPTAEVYASMEARRPAIESLLISAGLRQRDVRGNLELTARAARIDAGLEAP